MPITVKDLIAGRLLQAGRRVNIDAIRNPTVALRVLNEYPEGIDDYDVILKERGAVFRESALERGLRSLQATPLWLRDDVIGTMKLLDTRPGALDGKDVSVAQALSDVATIVILAERSVREYEAIKSQLQGALDSRIVMEEAKGVLAQSMGLSMTEAFRSLRAFARSHNLTLRAVATGLIERRLDASRVVAAGTLRNLDRGRHD